MVLILKKIKGLGLHKDGLGLENFKSLGLVGDGLNYINGKNVPTFITIYR